MNKFKMFDNSKRLTRSSNKSGSIFLAVIVIFISLFFGVAAVIFPWWWIAAIVLSVVFIFIGFTYPLVALIALVGVASHLIPHALLPTIRVLGGTVPASDMALFAAYVFCLLKYNRNTVAAKQALSTIIIPLILVLTLLFFSVARSAILVHLPMKDILGESRHFLYWLLIPLIALACADKARFRFVVFGILALAFLFSISQIVQGFFGVSVSGRQLASLETLGQVSGDVTRSTTPGIHIIVWGFLFVLVLFTNRVKFSAWLILLCMILFAGIFLTYGRMVWAATVMAVMFLCWKLEFKKLIRALRMLAIVGVLGLGSVLVLKPSAIEGAIQRLFSVEDEVSHGSSLGWRFYENEMSWIAIQQSPLIGIGLGAPYRPSAKSDANPEQVRYVHSAYIFLILKTGLVVFSALLYLIFRILQMTYKLTRSRDAFIAGFAIASFAAMLEYFIACFTQPELMQTAGIAFLATIAGLVCAATYLNNAQELDKLKREV
ncbi:MAG: hypothetical protein CTY12_02565 [Methylotenera sp.]|nr:MAG: hypothetical protein CTY12_02565 [Methylotenera sp.]